MNDDDASRHDSYLAAYLKTGTAKVIGSTRRVLAKTADGQLVPVNLSISKSVNPDDESDVLFTGMLNPVAEGATFLVAIQSLVLAEYTIIG